MTQAFAVAAPGAAKAGIEIMDGRNFRPAM